MKNTYLYLVGAVVALLVAGCGKSGSGSGNSSGTVGVCSAGLVNTQYGCLQQGFCPAGQAQYNNNQCVPATSNQCPAGQVYSSLVSTCIPQAHCQMGQGLYNNQCIQADGLNNGYQNGYNGYNTGYNTGYNPGYNTGYNGGVQGGFNAGFNFQYGHNPYLPQQNYNTYWSNPYYNPYWTPQYQYGW